MKKKILLPLFAAMLVPACKDMNNVVTEESLAFFPAESPHTIVIDPDGSSFDVTIGRTAGTGKLSFPLEASDTSGLFSIPAEVSFADGETSKSVTIGYEYNEEDFPLEKYYGVTLSIPSEFRSDSGAGDYSFEAGVSVWLSLGKATYTDDIISGLFGTGVVSYEVEIQENRFTEGLFRLVNPYGAAFPYNDVGTWDDSKDYYLEINATDPDCVYIEEQELGIDWGYGPVLVESLGWYYYASGNEWDEIKEYYNVGTYDGESIWFGANGLLAMIPQIDEEYRDSNLNGAFLVVMPGAGDYSVKVSHAGRSAGAQGCASAYVTLGNGVEYADVSLYAGKYYSDEDDDEAEAGELVGTQRITGSGTVSFECGDSGIHYITAVSYGKGSARRSSSAMFYYSAPEPQWTEYGKSGDYDYTVYWLKTGSGLTLYKDEADPYYFRIADWAEGVDFTFYWNEANDDVLVDDLYVGAERNGYRVYAQDFTYFDQDPDPWSWFENDKFIFYMSYYTDTGLVGSGYEYFTLTLDEAAELSDLVGTYDVYEKSAYYDDAYDTPVTWVIEASDDSSKGNVMLTVFDDFECQTPIYGDFSGSTGTFKITGTQFFYEYTDDTYGPARLCFAPFDTDFVTFTMDGPGAFYTNDMFERDLYYGNDFATSRHDDQYFSATATRVDTAGSSVSK